MNMIEQLNELRIRASARRSLLIAAGIQTFELLIQLPEQPGDEPEYAFGIVCVCCGFRSHNHNDIERLYCGFCYQYHEEVILYETNHKDKGE